MGRVQAHNREIMATAEYRAEEMKTWPSKLEERMQQFLEYYKVEFEAQKIFYIYADDGWIIRYYIADFYIPDKKIIIEVDGSFHDKQKQHDKDRTKIIQENYPGVEVLRYKWDDMFDNDIIDDLVYRIGGLAPT